MWKLLVATNLRRIYKKFFIKVFGILITIADIFLTYPKTFIASLKPKKTIPPVKNKLLLVPAIILARKIREGTLTSERLITTFIERIKEVNPIVNAVVEDRFMVAIEEAKKVDKIISDGTYSPLEMREKYPLLGIPITVKESIAVAGMSNNAGLLCSREKAPKDANAVEKVKEAGAIVLAVTNTPELCLDWECMNKVTGRTSNPYDNRRTSGGSSGGEAALLSSAASVIGIGSDTLGSLRLPAHFCGIFSHKPTSHAVPVEGHFPGAEEKDEWEKAFNFGPMARYSVDLALLFKILCYDHKRDVLALDRKVDYSELKMFYMESLGDRLTHPVIPEIVNAIRITMRHFSKKYKTTTLKWELPDIRRTAGRSIMSLVAIKGVDDIFSKDPNKSVILELLKYFVGLSQHIFMAISYLVLHRFHLPYDMSAIRRRISMSKKTISETLGNNGVLICPTFPIVAPYHGEMFSKSYNNIYMSVFNSLGFPVTVCPVGFTTKGLPIGLQIIAKEDCDRLTIAVAQEIETIFGGWKWP